MALVITIATVNRTSVVETDSIRISQVADSFTFTAELSLFDADGDITILAGSHNDAGAEAVRSDITIVDGATTYFGGYVVNQDILAAEDGSRHLNLQCQGYGIRLNETLVASEAYTIDSDKEIIDDLFDTYLAAFDSDTEVAAIVDPLAISFTEMTLAEIMEAICERTKGRWYVDNSKQVHYFADEGNDAGFDLSDEPNDVTSFSYFAGPRKDIDAAAIVNRVRVVGADDFAVTRNDATSQTAYGIRGAIVTDQTLDTTAAMEERGDDILDKNKDPRITYTIRTYHAGAVAGNEIDFKCDELNYNSISDGDDPLVIRELMIIWRMNVPVYEMTLGTHAETVAISRASYIGGSIRKVVISPTVPIASHGWSCDMVFSATDYNTVAWAGGDITLAGGTGTFSIDAGNTGNMAATTYIYLDTDVSATVLQTTTSAPNAIGGHKILIAVAAAVADDASGTHAPLAEFAVFGGKGTGVLITDSSIAADTITADLIGSNNIITVTANVTDAVITNAKITDVYADRITADKIRIGEMLFFAADGLLLLNPPIRIEKPAATSYWHATRKQKATLSGAIHLEHGRWRGTKAVVVEPATTNLYANPSAETDADDWDCLNGAVTRSDDQARFGSYSFKCALVPVAGGDIFFDTVNPKANPGQGEIYAASFHAYGTDTTAGLTATVQCRETGGVTATEQSIQAFTLKPGWQRIFVSHTIIRADRTGADAQVLMAGLVGAEIIYFDACQFEEMDAATSYCDGSLPRDGYAWTGVAHNSTSTRAATEVNLDTHAGLLDGNDTFSFRVVVQTPYDYDATWPANFTRLYEVWEDADNRIGMYFDQASNRIYAFMEEANTVVSAFWAADFTAGDWLDIIATYDTAGDIKLYVNGVLEDTTDLSARSSIAPGQWNVGSDFNAASQGGYIFAEYALFDRVLTAIEVAQLYNLQRPLIDGGAMDKPGIYIIDGMFRIQSSQTGNRIVITAEEIAGYDAADTKQFYLQSSDGKAYLGGGSVMLDETGITLVDGTAAVNKVKWHSGTLAGTLIGSIYADWAGGGGDAAITWLISEKIAGSDYGAVILRAADTAGAGDDVRLVITSDNTMVVDEVDTVAWNDNALNTYIYFDESTGIEIRGTRDLRCGGGIVAGSATVNQHTGTLGIVDGVTVPGNLAGFASIYIDTADGDLKCRFGDGFVAVIAADS